VSAPSLVLVSLHCYPIKSCRGVTLPRARLDLHGLAHDRRWMVVDAAGRFVSQREDARLATIGVAIEPGGALRLSRAGQEDLVVETPSDDAPERDVVVWSDPVRARSAGEAAARWFGDALGGPFELVWVSDSGLRRIADPPPYARDRVGFADAMPVLLANRASLDDLNRRLDSPLPMNRFRPNLVVAGAAPWAEDEWTGLRVGEARFRGVRPCGRCVVTTTDQETGERGVEPLRTLATFRRQGARLVFGRYLVLEGPGEVAVGDEVAIG